MKKNNDETGLMIAIIVVVSVVMAGLYFTIGNGRTPVTSRQGTQTTVPIRNSGDLDAAASELDETDMEVLDQELKLLESDASAF